MKRERRVSFEDNVTIRHYDYNKEEDMEEKLGKDWLQTQDLIYREFDKPIEKGGCGRDWNVLQSKLDKLREPCWKMIGMLWNKLYPHKHRLEELIESDYKEINNSDTDSNDTDSNDSSMYDENCNSCNILNNDFTKILEEDYDDIYYFL
jgi:hypothetical protein